MCPHLVFLCGFYLAHVIEQPNFRIPNTQYFVYLLDQTVGRDILQFNIEITKPFLILSKSQRSLKMCSQNHLKNQNKNFVVNIRDSEFWKLVVQWRERNINVISLTYFLIFPHNSTTPRNGNIRIAEDLVGLQNVFGPIVSSVT